MHALIYAVGNDVYKITYNSGDWQLEEKNDTS